MPDLAPTTISPLRLVGVEELRKKWGWFLALGILSIVLGTVALGQTLLFGLASMVLIGWLMIVGGVLEAIHSFACKDWGGFLINLLIGILYAVVGFMVVSNPAATLVALTLLIAMFLIFGGAFRIAAAIILRFPHWGWLLLHGVVTLVLGILIWQGWPESSLFIIGMFIGIDMIFNGWTLVMLAFAAKNLPTSNDSGAPAAV